MMCPENIPESFGLIALLSSYPQASYPQLSKLPTAGAQVIDLLIDSPSETPYLMIPEFFLP